MTQFGEDGHRGGRKPGSRTRLSKAFLDDLLERWQIDGKSALAIMVKEEPSKFVQVCAALMPKELDIEATVRRDEMQAWLQWVTPKWDGSPRRALRHANRKYYCPGRDSAEAVCCNPIRQR
jgi:hypothetical protein